MQNIRTSRMLRVSKAKYDDLRLWREGANLIERTGRNVSALQRQAAGARWRFARLFFHEGTRALKLRPAMNRIAVARFYYAMYHALRTVVYLEYDGDDHEEHRQLPTKEVKSLPQDAEWRNKVKSARAYRNQADYDPYPISDAVWHDIAHGLRRDAEGLLSVSRVYLIQKGCNL